MTAAHVNALVARVATVKVAAARGRVLAVTPEAAEAAEDGAAVATGLAVVVAAAVTGVTGGGRVIHPGIDIPLAAMAARVSVMQRHQSGAVAARRPACHRADATAAGEDDDEAQPDPQSS